MKFDDVYDEINVMDLDDKIRLRKMLDEDIYDEAKRENRCPICGEHLIITAQHNTSPYGSTVTVEEYDIGICPSCGEV
ncbi:MAG: hypothetical protein AVO34_13420 [Firmicutes bacterium ML8_F2]|jgi:YgiT-type zinc finger domain-containing protein|nr:MAG: hypothetical protein AVO34_13420 [Firmicutes bacterium ML8_F2]